MLESSPLAATQWVPFRSTAATTPGMCEYLEDGLRFRGFPQTPLMNHRDRLGLCPGICPKPQLCPCSIPSIKILCYFHAVFLRSNETKLSISVSVWSSGGRYNGGRRRYVLYLQLQSKRNVTALLTRLTLQLLVTNGAMLKINIIWKCMKKSAADQPVLLSVCSATLYTVNFSL